MEIQKEAFIRLKKFLNPIIVNCEHCEDGNLLFNISYEDEFLGELTKLKDSFFEEISINQKFKIDKEEIRDYFNEAYEFFNFLMGNIHFDQKEMIYHCDFIKYDKDFLEDENYRDLEIWIPLFTQKLHNQIVKIIVQLKELEQDTKFNNSKKTIPQEDKKYTNLKLTDSITKLIARRNTIKSFKWNRKDSFKKDMLRLHALLTDNKYNIISKETNFVTFCRAFLGEPIIEPLKIIWLVTGKNKQTSKSSLFYFISVLQDYQLIESKEWNSKNYGPLYRKISVIFVDKEGRRFSIEGLKSSNFQALNKIPRCAMQNEIDHIVDTVVKIGTDNLPK